MKALDVFVLCSRNEGFGRVVAEATAAGTTMVVSREGALPELVRDVPFAQCVFPGDAPAFAQAILASPAAAPANARYSDFFRASHIAARTWDSYQRACAQRPRAGPPDS